MRVLENRAYTRRSALSFRVRRTVGSAALAFAHALLSAWQAAFPTPSADDPNTPPTIAKAAALREGALLSSNVEAVSDKRIA
jgi:hypothetical protein